MNYYTDVLKKYAVFSGRATRKEYWMFALINVIVLIVLYGIGEVINTQALYYLYSLAVLIPNIAVATRRLHDTDRSGWLQLIALIPLVGSIILIVFLAQKGTAGPNKYDLGAATPAVTQTSSPV